MTNILNRRIDGGRIDKIDGKKLTLPGEAVGEDDFAVECRRIRKKGMRYVDEHLFNGEYYLGRTKDK
mgnify:CR=1 FL=1